MLTHLQQFQRRTHDGAARRGGFFNPSSLPGISAAFPKIEGGESVLQGKRRKVAQGDVRHESIVSGHVKTIYFLPKFPVSCWDVRETVVYCKKRRRPVWIITQ